MSKREPAAFILVLAAALAIRLFLLAVPGAPKTDVFYYDTQAVSDLLRGANPYGHIYVVPPTVATPGAARVFAYLPGVFAFLVPAGAAMDIRVGLILADVVAAISLYAIRGKYSVWSAAIFLLLPPTILFSTWFPDNSMPAIAFLAVAIAVESRGKRWASAALWGLAAASSQLVWLVFPLYLYRSYKLNRLRDAAVSGLVAVATVVPFLLWAPGTFFYDTTLFQFEREALSLVTPGPFGINLNLSIQGIASTLGFSVPLVVRAGVVVLVLAVAMRYVKGSLGSLLLASTLFLTVTLFVLPEDLYLAYFELPLFMLLAWFALRGERAAAPREAPEAPPSLKT